MPKMARLVNTTTDRLGLGAPYGDLESGATMEMLEEDAQRIVGSHPEKYRIGPEVRKHAHSWRQDGTCGCGLTKEEFAAGIKTVEDRAMFDPPGVSSSGETDASPDENSVPPSGNPVDSDQEEEPEGDGSSRSE